MNEDLVGYLLGALDRDAKEKTENRLSESPELQRQLERIATSLLPLSHDSGDVEPPQGLAERTIHCVLQSRQPEQLPVAPLGQWRLTDLALAAGILMTLSLIILPAINESRRNRAFLECKNNIYRIGVALESYAEKHSGYLPFYSTTGPLGVGGIYAPLLMDCQYTLDPGIFVCPSSGDPPPSIPSLGELRGWQDQMGRLEQLLKSVGGGYGSLLGHMDSGRYQAPNLRRIGGQSILVDRPCRPEEGEVSRSNSHNHGGHGQNALCRDGSVRFFSRPRECPNCDQFFVNQLNCVGPGLNMFDQVFVVSETRICPECEKF